MSSIPLVFLHGFLGTQEDWKDVCSFLPDETSIAIDLPGHGTSPFTENFFSLIPPLPKMHLIGYSMGGRLALHYANAFPEKIVSLTLLSTNDNISPPERYEVDLKWAEKMVHCFDDFLKEWYDQPIFAGFKPDLAMRKQQNPRLLAQALLHYSSAKLKLMKRSDACMIIGERDQKYRKLYPDAIVVPNAGHMVHLEQPEWVANVINKRIYGLDPSR